jgi:toxin YoeB
MKITFTEDGWEDYKYWQAQDRKTLRRVNQLIADIERNGNIGIGKPEPLKYIHPGLWSRRIDEVNRLVYLLEGDKLEIQQCRGHYED